MKNSIILPILAVLLGSVFTARAQSPNWTVNPTQYEHSMFVTGVVYGMDEQMAADTATKVGAFIDDEVRGVANLSYESSLDQYVAYLLVYSNDPIGQVSFRIYDANADEVVTADSLVDFAINSVLGSLNEPFLFIPDGLRDIVLSIDEVDGITTKFYPNPATDYIQIESREAVTRYQLLDALGQTLRKGKGQLIAVDELPPGRYYLLIETHSGQASSAFIKR